MRWRMSRPCTTLPSTTCFPAVERSHAAVSDDPSPGASPNKHSSAEHQQSHAVLPPHQLQRVTEC